ncbi:MAG: DUF4340 domain-containing protein [Lachnospiraceae bacterium]|nr:DUF4340 domain-containing protein [Lachnospiraceae bacterium]
MKKQKIQLLVMVGALLVLLAAFFCVKIYNSHLEEQESLESEPKYTVLDLDENDVNVFSFDNEYGRYSFEKSNDDEGNIRWVCLEEADLNLDSDKVSSVLNSALFIQADTCIEDVSDLEQYGLADPAVSVSITTGNGESYTLLCGDYNGITSKYYLGLDGESVVYALDSDIGGEFNILPDDLVVDEVTLDFSLSLCKNGIELL